MCVDLEEAMSGMTDPVPSKDEAWSDGRIRDELRVYAQCLSSQHVSKVFAQALGLILRQQARVLELEESLDVLIPSWRDGCEKDVEMSALEMERRENEQLRQQIESLSIHAEKWVKRALDRGAAPEPPAEPDMRHPKIQALIGGQARLKIELQIIESMLEPDY